MGITFTKNIVLCKSKVVKTNAMLENRQLEKLQPLATHQTLVKLLVPSQNKKN
jgi:hypothetical protein